jgi:8-oxo-dGTP diphosphatase
MPRSYPDRPFIGVGAVVLKGDHVLLIRRGKPPRLGAWSIPGGAQEVGETVFETARREVLEETGITIGPPRLIDVLNSIQRDDEGRVQFHYTLIDVVAPWQAGEPTAGSDAMHAEWMLIAEALALDMWAETRRVIDTGRRLLNGG